MKYDKLEIIGLPKSFAIYKATDYLYPDNHEPTLEEIVYDEYPAECDEEKGEDASVIFKYDESSTGVYTVHNRISQSLSLFLSKWAVEADVRLYGALINAILKKHPRAKLYDKYAPLKGLTDDDVEQMVSDRNKYLKKLLQTKEGFTMEGLNSDFTLKVEHLKPASSIDMQVYELQQMFTMMQWENDEEY